MLIAQSTLDAEQKSSAQQLLAKAILEVAGGELLDTESSFVPYENGNARITAHYKTASYSFVAPLVIGATIAGASIAHLKTLEKLAISLGIAYQLVDDLIGVFGDEAFTGKSTVGDIREGKRTLLVEYAVEAMSDSEKKWFDDSFGKPHATDDDITSIKDLLERTGAKDTIESEIKDLSEQAVEELFNLDLREDDRRSFELLIKKVTKRSF